MFVAAYRQAQTQCSDVCAVVLVFVGWNDDLGRSRPQCSLKTRTRGHRDDRDQSKGARSPIVVVSIMATSTALVESKSAVKPGRHRIDLEAEPLINMRKSQPGQARRLLRRCLTHRLMIS